MQRFRSSAPYMHIVVSIRYPMLAELTRLMIIAAGYEQEWGNGVKKVQEDAGWIVIR